MTLKKKEKDSTISSYSTLIALFILKNHPNTVVFVGAINNYCACITSGFP